MPKLIIGNNYNEVMIGNVAKAPISVRLTAASDAKRLAWFVQENDILVTPTSLSRKMIEYISKTMEKEISLNNFMPISTDEHNPTILTSDTLLNETLTKKIKAQITYENNWEILPYFCTSSISHLSQILNIPPSKIGRSNFMIQSGADLLNSKAVFRALMAGQVPIAPGNVCRTPHEMYYAIQNLLLDIGTVIVKQNMNASGDGNIVLTLENREAYPGAREVFKFRNCSEITLDFLKQLWFNLSDSVGNNLVVVESYFPSKCTLYAEYEISQKSNKFSKISYGIVRMDESGDKHGNGMVHWVGFQIPTHLSQDTNTKFLSFCDQLAEIVLRLGYEGHINFDAILTEDDNLIFTETNGRMGGCSHLHPIAEKLIGPNYLASHCLLTRNRVAATDIDAATKAAQSLCYRSNAHGVVILNDDLRGIGFLEYMVFAQSFSDANALEKELAHILSKGTAK